MTRRASIRLADLRRAAKIARETGLAVTAEARDGTVIYSLAPPPDRHQHAADPVESWFSAREAEGH